MVEPENKNNDSANNIQPGAEGAFTRFVGIILILGFLYYLFIWPIFGEGVFRWVFTGVLVVMAVLFYIFTLARSARAGQAIKVLSNSIVVVTLIFGAMLLSTFYTPESQSWLFKVFVIVYFSLLPPWLYLQFISTKGRTLWDEFVGNLFRLRVDNFANLPEPSERSIFHAEWKEANGGKIPPKDKRTEKTIYQKKFEGLFGPVLSDESTPFAILRGENLWPVAFATLIISVGWVFVVVPETLFGFTIFPAEQGTIPTSIGSLSIPMDTFRFAFLGAYFYVLQMLVRRYFQNDLKTSAYVNSIMRVIIVILLVWVVDMAIAGIASPEQRHMLAFIIGVFPHVGWQALQSLVKLPIKTVVPSLQQKYPLSDLDGLNIWYESRLLEEGIEDMQNLVTANLVDVMLNTRIPVERLVDWVDQSILYLHVGSTSNGTENSERTTLRRFGIRTATDLEDVFTPSQNGSASNGDDEHFTKLAYLLNFNGDEPSVLRSVISTLKNEPNYYQVQQWKEFPKKQFHDTSFDKALKATS